MFPGTQTTLTLQQLLNSNVDIGLKDYPIWNEEHRKELNEKIIDHFMFFEIGAETPGRFIFNLNRKMREIMPYYVKYYETTLYEYNPLYNADYTIEYTRKNNVNDNSNNKSTGSSENRSSTETNSENNVTTNTSSKNARVDTPQSQLQVNDIETLTSASELSFDKSQGSDVSKGKTTGSTSDNATMNNSSESIQKRDEVETFDRHLKGNYGVISNQSLIKQERELVINIDMMIIKELYSCFYGLWE